MRFALGQHGHAADVLPISLWCMAAARGFRWLREAGPDRDHCRGHQARVHVSACG